MTRATPNKNYGWPIALLVMSSTLIVSLGFYAYQTVFTPNILVQQDDRMLYVPTGATYQTVFDSLQGGGYLTDPMSFGAVARAMGYRERVYPGAYQLRRDMTNPEAVRLLRSGKQMPVQIVFHNVRLKRDLAERLAQRVEATAEEIFALLNHPDTVAQFGFDTTTIVCMFIPNTYELYWNTSAGGVLRRMHREYTRFWNEDRRRQAEALGMTPVEVTILASIVEAETKKRDEMPRVAGVYRNRLLRGWNLEADPTVVFAVGDFSIKRVLNIHKDTDSPYNTYRYPGLPPGPINLPSITAIEATLQPEDHRYMFFCAREDFSGYHNFAVTLPEHNLNALRYRRALTAAGIR